MEFTFRLGADISSASVGTLIDIIAIIAIVHGGLSKNKTFIFVLNLFISNFLMRSICAPLSIVSVVYSCDKNDILCPFAGYVIFSLSGISLWNLSLISINRYVLIVHPNYFDTIFSVRNTRIILAVAWLYSPVLCALPLTRAWGSYMFDVKRCLCTPLNTDTGFRTFSLVSTAIITIVPISFCYLAILNKVRSSNNRINPLQMENSDRMKNQRQLMRTILVMISIFMIMNTPFIVTFLLDPNQEKFSFWIHSVSLYLGLFSYTTNTLTYTLMNKQIRNSLINIYKRIVKVA